MYSCRCTCAPTCMLTMSEHTAGTALDGRSVECELQPKVKVPQKLDGQVPARCSHFLSLFILTLNDSANCSKLFRFVFSAYSTEG